jgi:hypothetical protein
MAEVTGPISTLPGARHALPEGAPCDQHPDRAAVARIQGETDSIGSEHNDLCQECLAEFKAFAQSDEAKCGQCDWCREHASDLRNGRCFDEGTCGPVYRICGACAARQLAAVEAELEASGYYDGDDCNDEDIEPEDSDDLWNESDFGETEEELADGDMPDTGEDRDWRADQPS